MLPGVSRSTYFSASFLGRSLPVKDRGSVSRRGMEQCVRNQMCVTVKDLFYSKDFTSTAAMCYVVADVFLYCAITWTVSERKRLLLIFDEEELTEQQTEK